MIIVLIFKVIYKNNNYCLMAVGKNLILFGRHKRCKNFPNKKIERTLSKQHAFNIISTVIYFHCVYSEQLVYYYRTRKQLFDGIII